MAKGLLGVASAIAVITLLSKGVGFLRELVIAAQFGAGPAKDAYTIAYIVPALALIMLGGLTGPFHTATQKAIAALRAHGEDEAVPGVIAAALLMVGALSAVLAAATYLGAPYVVKAVAFGVDERVGFLATQQLRIMAPLILIGGLVGVLCGVSNDRGDYLTPSLSPLVGSVGVIAFLGPDPMALAWGTLVGGVGQLLLQSRALWHVRQGFGRPHFRHPQIQAMAWLLLPACISSGVGTLNVIVGTTFASQLDWGAIATFDYANKLVQLPLGVLMTALLIPLFPRLATAVAAQDRPELERLLNQGLATVALGTWPLAALFLGVGEPLVALAYQRGAFTAEATTATATVLGLLSLSMAAYGTRDLMVRVFYAEGDGRTPLLVSLGALAFTALAMALAVGPGGLAGLTLAATVATLVNALVVGFLLRRRLGSWAVRPALVTAAKAFGAGAIATAVGWGLGLLFPPAWAATAGFGPALAHACVRGAGVALSYGLVLALLGFPVWPFVRQALGKLAGRVPGLKRWWPQAQPTA